MYKKKIAMEQANGNNDEEVVGVAATDPLEGTELDEAPAQNGLKPRRSKVLAEMKKKKKSVFGVIKIPRKKIKKPKAPAEPAPEPDSDGEYEVEAIVDHKKEKGKTVFRIRWKGYPPNQDSWLPGNELSCKDILKKYKNKMKKETKDVYVVSKIIDHRRMKGTIFYRVRWENYSSKDDSWQSKESLSCNDLLKEYHEQLNDSILKREEAKLEAQSKANSSNNEYEVESIVNSKVIKGRTKYLIRWKGWDESDDTWEFEDTLNCPDLIRTFKKKTKSSPKKPAKAIKGKKRKRYDDSASEVDNSDDSDYGNSKKTRDSGEYEVAKVLNSRINKNGKWEFFVMWKGWGPEHNTWEPENHLNCPKLINQFLGKDKIPLAVKVKLEKKVAQVTTPVKTKRKPPSERGQNAGGLRGRTKGEMKVLKFSI